MVLKVLERAEELFFGKTHSVRPAAMTVVDRPPTDGTTYDVSLGAVAALRVANRRKASAPDGWVRADHVVMPAQLLDHHLYLP